MFIRLTQEMFYKKAKTPKDLPWHRDTPDGFILDVVATRAKPGRALDLGCGSGVFSVWLAKQGYEVTGLDVIPRAIEMSKERAVAEGSALTTDEAVTLGLEVAATIEGINSANN